MIEEHDKPVVTDFRPDAAGFVGVLLFRRLFRVSGEPRIFDLEAGGQNVGDHEIVHRSGRSDRQRDHDTRALLHRIRRRHGLAVLVGEGSPDPDPLVVLLRRLDGDSGEGPGVIDASGPPGDDGERIRPIGTDADGCLSAHGHRREVLSGRVVHGRLDGLPRRLGLFEEAREREDAHSVFLRGAPLVAGERRHQPSRDRHGLRGHRVDRGPRQKQQRAVADAGFKRGSALRRDGGRGDVPEDALCNLRLVRCSVGRREKEPARRVEGIDVVGKVHHPAERRFLRECEDVRGVRLRRVDPLAFIRLGSVLAAERLFQPVHRGGQNLLREGEACFLRFEQEVRRVDAGPWTRRCLSGPGGEGAVIKLQRLHGPYDPVH